MKKLIFLICLVWISLACTQKGQYTITGSTSDSNLEGKNVYLIKYDNKNLPEKSDTVVVKNGQFVFNGTQEASEVYYLVVDYGEEQKSRAILLEEGKLTVSIGENIVVNGSPANDAYEQCLIDQYPFQEQMMQIEEKTDQARKDSLLTDELEKSLDSEYNVAYDKVKEIYARFFENNVNNSLGQELLAKTPWTRRISEKQLADIVNKADSVFQKTVLYGKMKNRLAAMKITAVGNPFIDIVSKDPDGNKIALSDFAGKGKYVLIDFWASWCPPCRKEMPLLVEAYKTFKNKNFEIVGYSLDKTETAWKNGLQSLGMTWPQMSDCQYWDSDGVLLYAVQSIPHTVLVDPNGIIIERNLNGKELLAKLQEILK